MKKALTVIALLTTFLLIAALASVVWFKTRPAKSYADMDAFSAAWKACPEEDRHELLDWLLGQEATGHTRFQVANSQLQGLTRQEVIKYLGAGDSNGTHYSIGPVDSGFITDLIYPITQHLLFDYDDNDVISYIEITT